MEKIYQGMTKRDKEMDIYNIPIETCPQYSKLNMTEL